MNDMGARAPDAAQLVEFALAAPARAPKLCSTCQRPGHYAPTCPDNPRPPPPPRVTGSRAGQAARWVREHGVTLREAGAAFRISHQAVSQAWWRIYGEPTPVAARTAARRARVLELLAAGRRRSLASSSCRRTRSAKSATTPARRPSRS